MGWWREKTLVLSLHFRKNQQRTLRIPYFLWVSQRRSTSLRHWPRACPLIASCCELPRREWHRREPSCCLSRTWTHPSCTAGKVLHHLLCCAKPIASIDVVTIQTFSFSCNFLKRSIKSSRVIKIWSSISFHNKPSGFASTSESGSIKIIHSLRL